MTQPSPARAEPYEASWHDTDRQNARVDELVELMNARKYGVGRDVTPIAWRTKHGISATQQAKETAAARHVIRRGMPDDMVMASFEANLERVIDDALEVSVTAAKWEGSEDDRELVPDQGTRVQALKLIKDAVMDYAKLRGLGVTQKHEVQHSVQREPDATVAGRVLAWMIATPELHGTLIAAADAVRAKQLGDGT